MLGKYILLWSLNQSLIPVEAKERAAGWGMLMEMVKQDLNHGIGSGSTNFESVSDTKSNQSTVWLQRNCFLLGNFDKRW